MSEIKKPDKRKVDKDCLIGSNEYLSACVNHGYNIGIDEMETYYEPLLKEKDNIISGMHASMATMEDEKNNLLSVEVLKQIKMKEEIAELKKQIEELKGLKC